MYWSDEDFPKERTRLSPLLTKIHIFLIYMSRIELEDTSAKKRSVLEIVITDSISQCWAILKNTHIAYIYAIYCLK